MRNGEGRLPVITPTQAFLIAKSGNYEGKVRSIKGIGRVTHIREIIRPGSEPDFAFWEDRACIRYHDNDVPNSPSLKIRRQLLAAIWDRAVNDPPPRWRPRAPANNV